MKTVGGMIQGIIPKETLEPPRADGTSAYTAGSWSSRVNLSPPPAAGVSGGRYRSQTVNQHQCPPLKGVERFERYADDPLSHAVYKEFMLTISTSIVAEPLNHGTEINHEAKPDTCG
ncbi:hypothetical protein Tco_0533441 [Tanacetum coccineum]